MIAADVCLLAILVISCNSDCRLTVILPVNRKSPPPRLFGGFGLGLELRIVSVRFPPPCETVKCCVRKRVWDRHVHALSVQPVGCNCAILVQTLLLGCKVFVPQLVFAKHSILCRYMWLPRTGKVVVVVSNPHAGGQVWHIAAYFPHKLYHRP